MDAREHCAICGAPLSGGGWGRRCLRCLLRLGLGDAGASEDPGEGNFHPDLREAARCVQTLARAVDCAHLHGILHLGAGDVLDLAE